MVEAIAPRGPAASRAPPVPVAAAAHRRTAMQPASTAGISRPLSIDNTRSASNGIITAFANYMNKSVAVQNDPGPYAARFTASYVPARKSKSFY